MNEEEEEPNNTVLSVRESVNDILVMSNLSSHTLLATLH